MAQDILEEMIWATRCAICDAPGPLLCSACQTQLAFIDRWQACPICGAAAGRIICTECNHFTLHERGLDALPFNQCTSVLLHDEHTRRIIITYKDAGEQRLSTVIAAFCADAVSPAINRDGRVLTYIPSSKKALTRRGFDHAYTSARQLARFLDMPLVGLFERPRTRDQRELNRRQRQQNMRTSLQLRPHYQHAAPPNLLLYDDVYTTGATLCAASETLREAGCADIRCLTFSRVP